MNVEPKWLRAATAQDVADTIVRIGGDVWESRSDLDANARRQLERSYGFSNAFFAVYARRTWYVAPSRIASLRSATPESFLKHRTEIPAGLARDYVLRFADPVAVSPDHPAALRLRSMLTSTPYRGKGGSKIYVLRGYDKSGRSIDKVGGNEEEAFISYLLVRAPLLSAKAKSKVKDIASKL